MGKVSPAMERASVLPDMESPGVRAVIRAVMNPDSDTEVRGALRLLAWERSTAGSGHLDMLLADLDLLWDALGLDRAGPIALETARRYAVDAWVDAVAAAHGAPSVDPLSGLHTPSYLIGRVHEMDRAAGNDDPPALVLIVIRWRESPNPWLRIAAMLRTADVLTRQVRSTATLCQAGVNTALVLVPDDGRSRAERAAIERELGADPVASGGLSVDIVPVLNRRDTLPVLIDRLRARST